MEVTKDDVVPSAESGEELDRMVGYFDDVCKRRMLKLNVSKIKSLVFEKDELLHCNVSLNGQENGLCR